MAYQQEGSSSPLFIVQHTQKDYLSDLRIALMKGDAEGLRWAVSHLSQTELDLSFTYNADYVFRIEASDLPQDMRDDLPSKIKISPLHYVAMVGDKVSLEILVKGGANPNIKDSFGQTPLHLLPKGRLKYGEKEFRECFEILLSLASIDTNRLDWSKSTPFSQAETFHWSFMVNRLGISETDSSSKSMHSPVSSGKHTAFADALLKDLLDNHLEGFKNTLSFIKVSDVDMKAILNESHGNYTLLQYACKCGLFDFVDELLSHGASPTKKDFINILSPIIWATKYGYHRILRRLIQSMTQEDLRKGSLQVCNETMETPLHMVAICDRKQDSHDVNYYQCLLILLEQKNFLNLDAKNDDGNTPLHFAALCHDLRTFNALMNNGANFSIPNVIGLTPLHYVKKEAMIKILNNCIEYEKEEKIIDKNFWISLDYRMMDSKRFVSKCQKGITSPNAAELNFLNLVTEIFEDKDILKHPLLDVFINIKWHNIRRYFYLNFAIHFLFLVLLITYIAIYHTPHHVNDSPNGLDVNESHENVSTQKYNDSANVYHPEKNRSIFASFLLLTLILWQIVQLFMTRSWKVYFYDVKKMIEVITLVLTGMLLFSSYSDLIKMDIAAWLTFFASLEFILQLGQLPRYADYVTMLNTVAWNFFKFISLFSGVIVAFSFSFYLMLHSPNGVFSSFSLSLVKTIAMTAGELEYGSWDFSEATFPAGAQVLLTLFVFLILLVLVNLLNGLAISDIQDIQRRAEIISRRSLIDRMTQLERAFYCQNSRNPLKRILDILFNITLTFRHCLPKHRLVIYVSRNPIEYSNNQTHSKFICHCHSYTVETKNIHALMQIVLEKKGAVLQH